MADQRIQYTEELVGANHPTKTDSINRLALCFLDSSGYPKSTANANFRIDLNATAYTIGANSSGKIAFSAANLIDSNGGWVPSTIYKTPVIGTYVFGFNFYFSFASTSSAYAQISILKNAAGILSHILRPASTLSASESISIIDYSSSTGNAYAVDYINYSAGALNIYGNVGFTNFWGCKIGG